MTNYLLVFVGGGWGSICRFGIGHFMAAHRLQFPWATFMANFPSCFVLGALVALSFKGKMRHLRQVNLRGMNRTIKAPKQLHFTLV
jgi:fluoride ion exporter CrcB/FEX